MSAQQGGQAGGQQQQQQQQQTGGGWTRLLIAGGLYLGLNGIMSYATQKTQKGSTVTDPNTGEVVKVAQNTGQIPAYQLRPDHLDEGATYRAIPKIVAPIWPQDSHVDIVITVSPSFSPLPLSDVPDEYVVMREKGFHMDNSSDTRSADAKISVPKAVQNNGTLWGHFYVGLPGSNLDPRAPGFDPGRAFHFAYPLTQYLPKKKEAKTRNLLDDLPAPVEDEKEDEPAGPIIANYYHPNASFSFVPNIGVKDLAQLPPAAKHFLHLESTGARDGSGQNGWYYPLLFVNTFWQLRSHMIPLNETVTELPLHIDLGNMAAWKFQMLANMEFNAKESARQAAFGNGLPTGGDGSEIEMVKEIFIDTNPILLGITAVVSVAHMILETLAFGSDIAHYRKKKDNVGISVRSILANVFMQTIIFLYLLDNSQNTSWMILGQQVIGILIEFWKITTVVNVRVRPSAPGSWLPYSVTFEDKHKLTDTEEKTKEYDEIAFKYMYWAAIPLLIAYGIYSLFYDTHKSWYSYIITTLVGSVYAYGFLMMVPSLYINYRLKSVAHMPSKAMGYKFLNTFIDDLFAFTIKMPFLHRMATLRDDVIFFIYLYQRYKYRVDYTRVNEFGQGGDDDEHEDNKEKEDEKKKTEEEEEEKSKAIEAEATKATGSAATGKAKKRK
ncbi:Cleft lip and palate transmembrane protein 1 (CLPTM1) [Geosmithia morbida]|uniref:Cleft lip and palate transmembrane protein 1 (CLPTM1) n=1 Tax=Geosmithia morbida TaxID=1094350 RepID=A0A9P5CZR3_9HYPO|nr:Cleft lip and palate transmembrane protein 1 (CLPTM1) [Geosmithia morbida]KAF4120797.1 Cleft lip and palate transmembrane protein 1 (CLPTM1) [Geosmithia morbida]